MREVEIGGKMEADVKTIWSILERNMGIQSALIGFLKEKGYLDNTEFIQYCSGIDSLSVKKELYRDEEAAKSSKNEMHPGGENATLALCKMAGLKKTDRVLDAGTGHGGAARIAAQNFGSMVTGLEFDYVRLINAIFRTKQVGLDHLISFCTGDAYHMPFADESFDVILRQHAVYGQQEIVFVKECFRVIKPGGRIAFQGILKRIPLTRNKFHMEDYSVDEYSQLLEECGFENIQFETENSNRELSESLKETDSVMYNLVEKNLITGVKIVALKR